MPLLRANDVAGGLKVEHNSSRTPGVQLATNDDFLIDETLSLAPPSTCDSPCPR
jgi:hypothetical protein